MANDARQVANLNIVSTLQSSDRVLVVYNANTTANVGTITVANLATIVNNNITSPVVLLDSGAFLTPQPSIVLALSGYMRYKIYINDCKWASNTANVISQVSSDGGGSWLSSPDYNSGSPSTYPIFSYTDETGFTSSPVTLSGAEAEITIQPGGYGSSVARVSWSKGVESPYANIASFGGYVVSKFQSNTITTFLGIGGIGYTNGDILTIHDNLLNNGRITVDTTNGSGTILTYHISTPATNQIGPSSPSLTTTGGSGTGASFTITYDQQIAFPITTIKLLPTAGNFTQMKYALFGIGPGL